MSRGSEAARKAWQAEIDRKPDSIREASHKYAAKARSYPNRTPDAVAERLRRKAIALPLTAQDMADIEGLIHKDSSKALLLDELAHGLRRLGIKVADPVVK